MKHAQPGVLKEKKTLRQQETVGAESKKSSSQGGGAGEMHQ